MWPREDQGRWTLDPVPFTPRTLVGSVRKEKLHPPGPGGPWREPPSPWRPRCGKNPSGDKHQARLSERGGAESRTAAPIGLAAMASALAEPIRFHQWPKRDLDLCGSQTDPPNAQIGLMVG